MKQWIFTIALSISLVCGQLEAAAGEYTIQKEQTGGTGQEQAGQGQAGQKQAGQGQDARTENADFLKLYAQSAVLMDGSSGRILYGKGQDIIRPMASTTKIMTCILALELGNLDDKVTASSLSLIHI